MTDPELRLRCLELALQHTKFSTTLENFQVSVAEMQTWFYNRLIPDPQEPKPETAKGPGRPRKADKAPSIFE